MLGCCNVPSEQQISELSSLQVCLSSGHQVISQLALGVSGQKWHSAQVFVDLIDIDLHVVQFT